MILADVDIESRKIDLLVAGAKGGKRNRRGRCVSEHVFGIHAVEAVLRNDAERVRRLFVQTERRDGG